MIIRDASVAEPPRPLDVIVADDEPSDQLLFSLAGGDADAVLDLTFVNDGQELMELLADRVASGNTPDIVVLDVRMPRCDGFEVMEAISSSAVLERIPVVMFTASRRDADKERGLQLGATKFEVKPSTYPELVAFANELVHIVRG